MARARSFAAKDRATTRRLIQAAQRGDRHAANELVRRYEPLVQRAVWRLKLPRWCEREDVAQEARLGLVAAMRAWRPERGAFPAFAQRCVKNQALLAVIAASRQKHHALNLAISLEDAAQDWPHHRDPLGIVERLSSEDPRADPESHLLLREEVESVVHALPALTSAERAALSAGLCEQTHEQLAEVLEVTPKAASQAAYRARRKLAAVLPRAA